MGRPRQDLTLDQVEEMIRLRHDGLNQRQIAKRLGVCDARVKRSWKELPPELRGRLHAAYVKASRTRLQNSRGVIKNIGDNQCPSCGMFFDLFNQKDENGECALCALQAMGKIVVYKELGLGYGYSS